MKKIMMSILLLSILFSCDLAQKPGDNDDGPINPTTIISDIDFTGEMISSDTEFQDVFLVLAFETFVPLVVYEMVNEASSDPISLLQGIDLTTYRGEANYTHTNTFTAINDNAVGQATVSASASIDNNLLFISIPGGDIYVPKDLSIFGDSGASGIQDGEVSLDFEANISVEIEDYSLEHYLDSYYDGSLWVNETQTVTVEDFTFDFKTDININLTNLDLDIKETGDIVDLDGGLLDLTFSYRTYLSASVSAASSTNSNSIKGGKIVAIADYERTAYNIDISSWDEDFIDKLISGELSQADFMAALESKGELVFGDFSNITADYYIYDNNNVEQFQNKLTLQTYYDMF